SRGFDIRTIGFPQYMYDAALTQGLEFPDLNVNGVSKLGQATFTTLLQSPTSHNLRFDVTKVLSRHTIKAGIQYNKLFMNFTQLGQPDGSFTFGDTFLKADSRASSVSTVGFGFAYKINPMSVFRGAYGILYGVSVMQAAGVSGSSGTEGFRGSTSFTASVDGGGVPFATMSNPFPLGLNLPLGAKEGPTSGGLTNIGAGIGESFFNDWVTPMGQQWNGTLQRELPGGLLVEAGYLGSKWQHLNDGESSMTYNQLPPSYLALA